MSAVLEFSIDGDDFALGQVLSGPPELHLELERIVPTGEEIVPYVWAVGDDLLAFEEQVRDSRHVRALQALDRVGDSGLYRLEWEPLHEPDLVAGIGAADGAVLEATGDGTWTFRLRFPDRDHVSRFYDYCTDNDVAIHVDRVYTPTDEGADVAQFDLSRRQREAVLLALRRGYFATPKQADLDELAGELDISRQATSNRIRRANEQILETVLLSSITDYA